jgi:hypothetical protein
MLADQLHLRCVSLKKALPLQLAIQGLRSKVNIGTKVEFQYQKIKEERYFNVVNIASYDMILGAPWIFQHKVTIGLKPTTVMIGSNVLLPLEGESITKIASRMMETYDKRLDNIWEQLMKVAKPICVEALDMDLPLLPLCAINHTIPLIDETKVYPWYPSWCPEPLWVQWTAKCDVYLQTGHWKQSMTASTVLMLMIMKPGSNPLLLWSIGDLRERNLNTVKMASPLSEQEGILCCVASKHYKSLIDLKDCFEQIQIIPDHVPWTAVTTPDGYMVSLVVQQGDCNAPTTCQALMNHLFGHISVFGWMSTLMTLPYMMTA